MTKFFNIFKKNLFFAHFPNFGGKKFFSRKSGSATHNFIWVSNDTTNDTIPRKRPGRQDGRKGGRVDRHYFIGPFRLTPGSNMERKAINKNR